MLYLDGKSDGWQTFNLNHQKAINKSQDASDGYQYFLLLLKDIFFKYQT